MPHAETNGNMSETMTNGDKPQSQFLSHLTSYPVVNDGINTFKSNPYGKRSLELTDNIYARFGKPMVPYLQTPYSFAAPYVAKADSLADSGLGTVETRFPIVKQDTGAIVDTAKSYALYPFKLAGQSKDYVLTTWDDEYKKTAARKDRGPGLTTSAMALVSTELKMASDAFQMLADFLGPKKDAAEHKSKDAYSKMTAFGQEKMGQAHQYLNDKTNQTQKYSQDKAGQAQQYSNEKMSQAEKKKDEAQEKVQQKTSK